MSSPLSRNSVRMSLERNFELLPVIYTSALPFLRRPLRIPYNLIGLSLSAISSLTYGKLSFVNKYEILLIRSSHMLSYIVFEVIWITKFTVIIIVKRNLYDAVFISSMCQKIIRKKVEKKIGFSTPYYTGVTLIIPFPILDISLSMYSGLSIIILTPFYIL